MEQGWKEAFPELLCLTKRQELWRMKLLSLLPAEAPLRGPRALTDEKLHQQTSSQVVRAPTFPLKVHLSSPKKNM